MSLPVERRTLGLLITDPPRADWAGLSQPHWLDLLRLAQQEGVGALLYWRLSRSGRFSALPEEVRSLLRSLYADTWSGNQRRFKELETLLDLLRAADIPTVLLKGGCYALTLYPDIGLRPMGDLDLLVPKAQFAEAVRLTRSLGYVDSKPEAAAGLKDLLSHEACLVKTDGSVVEIHHSLVADKTFTFAVPVDWFWEQTEDLQTSNPRLAALRMLTPTAQLLYAAAHAMLQHGGHRVPLRWEYDIDQLVRVHAARLDWDLLLAQARRFEWSSALQAALLRVQEQFDTPLSSAVRDRLAQSTDRHAALVARKQVRPATHILEERLKLSSLNWLGRWRLVWALVVPSPAYMRWRYRFRSHWMLPFWYLARWAGILRDGVRTLLALLRAGAPGGEASS